MKFYTAISAISLLAPGVLASPAHVHRDIATIQGVLSDINSQVNALETAITASPLDPESVLSQSDTLVQTITDGVATVNAQPALNQIDALGLVTPTQALADDTDATVQSLIGAQQAIVDLGFGCSTLESLEAQFDAATALATAIVSKVPAALADISQELADTIAAAIQAGIDAYQGSCDSGSTTTAPPTSTPPPTSTTPPTSTAPPTSTTSRTACPAPTK
ncbi:hydrophobic surface binding protein A-domain-containing protein [Aspergillus cavernicola]|uniref:Hydrophobic surface binding protein A-domain-containing protein n=1 Tax=Aspergillus cavernicola TaxID=176166 RepID=A0ABR4IDL0_9EURO